VVFIGTEEHMAERKYGAVAPETTSTISGEDWEGRDISGEKHTKVLFVDIDLAEVVNRGAVFTAALGLDVQSD
jgi:fluoroquinolone resistance protein